MRSSRHRLQQFRLYAGSSNLQSTNTCANVITRRYCPDLASKVVMVLIQSKLSSTCEVNVSTPERKSNGTVKPWPIGWGLPDPKIKI